MYQIPFIVRKMNDFMDNLSSLAIPSMTFKLEHLFITAAYMYELPSNSPPFCVVETCVGERAPGFGKTYMVQGVLRLPYAEIVEPFTAYYDATNNRSRTDYYGGN